MQIIKQIVYAILKSILNFLIYFTDPFGLEKLFSF